MRLARFGPAGRERPCVLLADGTRVDCSGFGLDWGEWFFESDGLPRLEAWLDQHAARAPRVDPGVRVGPPIARPSKIVGLGLNYSDHAAEMGVAIPKEPVLFQKSSSALCGPEDDLPAPRGATKLDWEVELAVVIGRRAANVERDRALEHVFGYTLACDYSERAWQKERGGQFTKGKSHDGFAPLGPFLLTAGELADPQRVGLWLTVNGETRQRGSTRDMIFGVAEIVSYVSQFMTLLPGDVITTGTPAGVGLGAHPPRFLVPGDVVELGADGLGRQRQRIVGEPAA
ncbi:MAG: fumarylacetoacetate hydrolase family protein [Planctomycetota bacterium]|nr:fumarylacetoacetate hydrolase family protein [Planctomycetota bacterium]